MIGISKPQTRKPYLPSAEELMKRYGLSREEVERWAKAYFPDYADNLQLMTLLYLKLEKGIVITPFARKSVSELAEGDRAEICVLIAMEHGRNEYLACPECYSKVEDRGGEYYCEKHGLVKEPITVSWRRYVAGDSTGTIIVALPPRLTAELAPGKTYILRGVMSPRGEFIVRNIVKEVEGIGKTAEKPEKTEGEPELPEVVLEEKEAPAKEPAKGEKPEGAKPKEGGEKLVSKKPIKLEVPSEVIDEIKDYLSVWGEVELEELKRWWSNMGYDEDYGSVEEVLKKIRGVKIEGNIVKYKEE